MPFDVEVDGSFFTFPDGWEVTKIDEWAEHTRTTREPINAKACDLLAIGEDSAWLIEAKDYTYPGAKIPTDLFHSIARKLWHSMGLIHSVARWGAGSNQESSLRALQRPEMNFCLAIELPDGGRRLKGLAKPLADVRAQLKTQTRLTGISHPVVSNSFLTGVVPWTVRRDPTRRDRHQDR